MNLTELINQFNNLRVKIRDFRSKEQDNQASVYFLRDKEGGMWFLGIYSNKFEDRYETILSSDSHQLFTNFLDESGFKPPVVVWHEPKLSEDFWVGMWNTFHKDMPTLQGIVDRIYKDTAFAKTERVFYMNGFSFVLAKVLPDKMHVAEALSRESGLGMSHGFVAGNLDDNIIQKYFSFEFTVLPRSRAGNFITGTLFGNTRAMEKSMDLDPDKRKFLERVLGEGIVEKLDVTTRETEQAFEEVLSYRDNNVEEDMTNTNKNQTTEVEETVETDPVVDETQETEVVEETPSADPAESITISQLEEFLTPVKDILTGMAADLQALRESDEQKTAQIGTLTEQVEILRRSDDDKIAAQVAPQNFWSGIGGYQGSRATDNVVDPAKTTTTREEPKLPNTGIDPDDPFSNLIGMAFKQAGGG